MGLIATIESHTIRTTTAKAREVPSCCLWCPNYRGATGHVQNRCSVLTDLRSPCFVDRLRRKHIEDDFNAGIKESDR